MTATFLLLLSAILSYDDIDPKTKLTLEPIPDDSEAFLSLPQDVAIGSNGAIYIADAMAKTVFVWKADGSFAGSFGKAGKGPGEFSFMGMGGPQAYLSVVGDQVLVYDGGNRSINYFDQNLDFKTSVNFQLATGRTNYFKATPSGEFVVYNSKWGEDKTRGVGLYGTDGKPIKEILEVPDTSYTTKMKDGKFSGLTLHAFSPTLVIHYDADSDQIIAGHSSKPNFEVYNTAGKLVKKVSFKMAQVDVTNEDQEEYNQQPWIRRSSWVKATFPDKKAYYDAILPVGDQFLVYRKSPFYVNLEGILIDGSGNTLSNFSMECGENGNLFSVNGRLMAVRTNDDGDFVVEELVLGDITG